jgi:O-methyltransferase
MKSIIKKVIGYGSGVQNMHKPLYDKYKDFTMIPEDIFLGNLDLCSQFKKIQGCVMEFGVWKGGTSAAIAELMGKEREYFLFDGFEGMPPAKEIDGKKALDWQSDKSSPNYLDNCKADISFAQQAMKMSGTPKYKIVKGWFNDTVPSFVPPEKIAILRLDCDWYDSMMICLDTLYKYVAPGGLIILDDYLVYEGCSRAVHDFLSKNNSPLMIRQHPSGVPYIINKI